MVVDKNSTSEYFFETLLDETLASAKRILMGEFERQVSSLHCGQCGAGGCQEATLFHSGEDTMSTPSGDEDEDSWRPCHSGARSDSGGGKPMGLTLSRASLPPTLLNDIWAETISATISPASTPGRHSKNSKDKDKDKVSGKISMRRFSDGMNFKSFKEVVDKTLGGKSRPSRNPWQSFTEILQRSCWDTVIAAVIILNTVTIGLSTDLQPHWRGWFFLDTIFAGIFFMEMLAKMKSGLRKYFMGPSGRWNIFEFLLVLFAVLEIVTGWGSNTSEGNSSTGSMVVFRVFRLARIARILRMSRLTVFSDLLMMINGATGGMRTFIWSVFLISLPVYSVALVLTDSLKDHDDIPGAEMFSNVGTSFYTVFRCVVGNDCTDAEGRPVFVLITDNKNWAFGLVYCITTLVMSFGLFNVIVAIYVENIVAAAKYNDAHSKRQRLRDTSMFAEKATNLVEFIWKKYLEKTENPTLMASDVNNLQITPEFFADLRCYGEFQDLLRDLDIADEDTLDLFDTLDVDGGGTIDLEELLTGLSKLRGDARRSDIVSVGLIVRSLQVSVQNLESKVVKQLKAHKEVMGNMHKGFAARRRRSGSAWSL